MTAPDWWRKPRKVAVVVDNPSWILPFAETLVKRITADGDEATLVRAYDHVEAGDIAYFLGCTGLASADVLARHRRNLVVHESDLPEGRGFAPLSWQILEGRKEIPVCLLEAVDGAADSGPVIYRDRLHFEGHELHDEIRRVQGEKTIELCWRFLAETTPPAGRPQEGPGSHYKRRRLEDSRLDPERTLREQFNLLRTVDNKNYPAFFDLLGQRYKVTIEKMPKDSKS